MTMRRPFATFAAVVCVMFAACQGPSSAAKPPANEPPAERRDERWQQAVAWLEAGEWAHARPAFAAFTLSEPANEWAWNNAGLCAMQLGEFDAAQEFLAHGEALAPGNVAIRTNLAFLAIHTGDLAAAVRHAQHRAELIANGATGPGSERELSVRLQFEIAEAHRLRGDRAASIAAHDAGMREFPDVWWFPEFNALNFVVLDGAKWAELKARAESLVNVAERESRISWRLPIAGVARIIQGHRGEVSHRGAIDAYAWDFAPVNAAADGSGFADLKAGTSGQSNADYAAWDQPVLAAADGVVTTVFDDVPDNAPLGRAFTYGNGIAIQHTDANGGIELSVYWHLKQGSARVAVGQRVAAGEEIGRIGNSGISLVPHLHFVVRRGPGLGPGLDARFSNAERFDGTAGNWLRVGDGVPANGEIVRPAPGR